MSRRKGFRKSKNVDTGTHEYTTLPCRGCGEDTQVESGCIEVLCGLCACKAAGPTDNMIRAEARKQAKLEGDSGRPRGWHLAAEWVDKDGNVFHKGVEVPELKGTKPPTPIETKPKLTKAERRKRREERKAKKEAKLAKRYTEVKKEKKLQDKSETFFNGEDDGRNSENAEQV